MDPEPQGSVSISIADFCAIVAVSLMWGATNPFLRKGAQHTEATASEFSCLPVANLLKCHFRERMCKCDFEASCGPEEFDREFALFRSFCDESVRFGKVFFGFQILNLFDVYFKFPGFGKVGFPIRTSNNCLAHCS